MATLIFNKDKPAELKVKSTKTTQQRINDIGCTMCGAHYDTYNIRRVMCKGMAWCVTNDADPWSDIEAIPLPACCQVKDTLEATIELVEKYVLNNKDY